MKIEIKIYDEEGYLMHSHTSNSKEEAIENINKATEELKEKQNETI